MPIKVEAVEAVLTSGAGNSRDLGLDRVCVGRVGQPVDLEIFGYGIHIGAQLLDERRVAIRRRHDDPRQEDDRVTHGWRASPVMPSCAVRRRTNSITSSTRLGSMPRQRITSSLVSKFGYEPTDTSGNFSSISLMSGWKPASTAKMKRSSRT